MDAFLLGGLDDLGGLRSGRCLHGATWVRKGASSGAFRLCRLLQPQLLNVLRQEQDGPPQYQLSRGGDPVLGRLPGVRAQPRGVVVHVLVLSKTGRLGDERHVFEDERRLQSGIVRELPGHDIQAGPCGPQGPTGVPHRGKLHEAHDGVREPHSS